MSKNRKEAPEVSIENGWARRREYDIDAFYILDELREQYKNHQWNSEEQKRLILKDIDNAEKTFIEFESNNGKDLTYNIAARNYILSTKSRFYPLFLCRKILTMDTRKIYGMLSYQKEKYELEKASKGISFFELMDEFVYKLLHDYNFLDEEIRIEKTVSWLDDMRLIIDRKKLEYSDFEPPSNSKPPIFEFIEGNIDIEVCNNLLEKSKKDKKFFKGKSNRKNLKSLLLKGENHKNICFNGQHNQLPEFFKRLIDRNELLVADKKIFAKWIVTSFVVKTRLGNTEKMSEKSVWRILKLKKNPVAKKNRILLDEYPIKNSFTEKMDKIR